MRGKELSGHVDGTVLKPTIDTVSSDTKKIGQWDTDDAKIMSWILSSVEPHIVLHLRSCKTAKGMWDYLEKVYDQDNTACRYQLETDITVYSQGNKLVQEILF